MTISNRMQQKGDSFMGATEKSHAAGYGRPTPSFSYPQTYTTATPQVVIDQHAWDNLKQRVKTLEKNQTVITIGLCISSLISVCLFFALVIAFG